MAGKSLDLTVTLVIGERIGAIVGTPRMDLVAMFALGLSRVNLDLFGHSVEIV